MYIIVKSPIFMLYNNNVVFVAAADDGDNDNYRDLL